MPSFFGSEHGHRPEIAGGLRGEALVLGCDGAPMRGEVSRGTIAGNWKRWRGPVSLQVRLPGREPYRTRPVCSMTREKYPIAGTLLPVTADPADPAVVRIEWDDVPAIDDWIAGGHEVFTDPDAAEARVREVLGPRRANLAPPGFGGPTARILTIGRRDAGGDTDSGSSTTGEMLLSVQVPGEPRRGLRWHGLLHLNRILMPWWDLPIDLRGDGGKVKIRWHDASGIEAVTPLVRSAADEMQARLSALTQVPATMTVPPPAAPPQDPLHKLEQLAALRDAGALTEAEFAAEKARVLGGT